MRPDTTDPDDAEATSLDGPSPLFEAGPLGEGERSVELVDTFMGGEDGFQ